MNVKELFQPTELVIESDAAWSAVSSPVRMEIVHLFESEGAMTVAELGAAMGRPADGLYHHIHILEEAGIIDQTGTRATAGGRRTEAVYELRTNNLMFSTEPRYDDKRSKALRVILNSVMRNVDRAIRSRVARLRGPDQNLVFRSEVALLTDDECKRVRSLLAEAESVFHGARGRKGRGRRTHAVLVMTPVVPHGRAAKLDTKVDAITDDE